MKRKVNKSMLSELLPVVIVAVLGYVLLTGSFSLFSILGVNNTVDLFESVPDNDNYPSGKAYADTNIVKVSENQVNVEVEAYSDITRFASVDKLHCDANSACVLARHVGSGNLVKVFVVDVDNSTYLDTVVSDEGILSNGHYLGLFAWDSISDFMVSTADVRTVEGKETMVAYEKCVGFEDFNQNCWKLPLGEASKTISLPEGNFIVEIRALNIKDIKKINIGDADNLLRDMVSGGGTTQEVFDRDVPVNSYYFAGSSDIGDADYNMLKAYAFLNPVFVDSGDEHGIYRATDFTNSVSREEMVLVDSLNVNVASSTVPPIVEPPIIPEEPPVVEPPVDSTQGVGLFDGLFAWLNGVWKAFIGLFYV